MNASPAGGTTVTRSAAMADATVAGAAPTRGVWRAAAAATLVVGVAWVVRSLAPSEAGGSNLPVPDPYDVEVGLELRLGLLLALGALCAVGLALRRSPSVAWVAAVLACALAASDLVDVGLFVRDPSGLTATTAVAAALCLALIAAVAIAVGYAVAPARRLHPAVGWLGMIVIAWLVLGSVVSVGAIQLDRVAEARERPIRWLTTPVRWWHYAALGFVGLGILGDVAAADRRARRRALRVRSASPVVAGRLTDRLTTRLNERVPPILDELVPGRASARDEAIEAERARLAAELHADVVPAVRRALEAVEAGGSVERLATDLREVLGQVEGLLAQRRSIVLEELGLVAGLEWLAERVEERGRSPVTIDVADDPAGTASGRAPRPVERAAFRVASLALENATRHAPGAALAIEVLATPARVRLVIADDGPGIAADRPAGARAEGRRGLADMQAEAASIGATSTIDGGAGGRGTVVRLDWPATG